MFGYNRDKKYKRAPTEIERRAHRAKNWRGDFRPALPEGMQRLSSMKKIPKIGTACIVKTSDGKTMKGKFLGYSFFPFAGDYPLIRFTRKETEKHNMRAQVDGERTAAFADHKIFFKKTKRKLK